MKLLIACGVSLAIYAFVYELWGLAAWLGLLAFAVLLLATAARLLAGEIPQEERLA